MITKPAPGRRKPCIFWPKHNLKHLEYGLEHLEHDLEHIQHLSRGGNEYLGRGMDEQEGRVDK